MLGLPSCREVAEQLSEDLDAPLKGARWLRAKLHLLVCAYCRRYGKQIRLSAETVRELDARKTPDPEMEEALVKVFRETHQHHKH